MRYKPHPLFAELRWNVQLSNENNRYLLSLTMKDYPQYICGQVSSILGKQDKNGKVISKELIEQFIKRNTSEFRTRLICKCIQQGLYGNEIELVLHPLINDGFRENVASYIWNKPNRFKFVKMLVEKSMFVCEGRVTTQFTHIASFNTAQWLISQFDRVGSEHIESIEQLKSILELEKD